MNPRTRRSRKHRHAMHAEYEAFNALCARFHWLKIGAKIHVALFKQIERFKHLNVEQPILAARLDIEARIRKEFRV